MKGRIVIGALLAAVAAAGIATYALGATKDSQTINACVNNEGRMRVVANTNACKKSETPLSWNTTGPAGQAGPAGPAGPAGRDGRDGAAGGTTDPDATAGTFTATLQKQGSIGSTPLVGISHEIVSPRDPASGLPTGKRQHKPLVITKEMDKSTPLLLNALTTNENITEVLIALLRDGKQVATVKLTNASIASYTSHGQLEHWSLTYRKIEWTWVDGGVSASDDWEAPVARR
jgi:type VI secretion system secreted protein Hcp